MTDTIVTRTDQYLTCTLGREIFALNIGKVREVLEVTEVSEIPRTPQYMKGVINLRGHAVPVVDMRLKLGMSETENTVDTCIIILEVNHAGEQLVMGALVDSVREVVEIHDDEIEPAPKMGASIEASYIKGMGRQGDAFIIIVDVDSIFTEEEMKMVNAAEERPEVKAA